MKNYFKYISISIVAILFVFGILNFNYIVNAVTSYERTWIYNSDYSSVYPIYATNTIVLIGGQTTSSAEFIFNPATGATTTKSFYIGGDLTVNGVTTVQNITLVNWTITGNATTTGYMSIGSAMAGFNYANGYLNVQNGLFANSATTTDTLRVGGALTAVGESLLTGGARISFINATSSLIDTATILGGTINNTTIGQTTTALAKFSSATTTASFYFPSGVIKEDGSVGIGTTTPAGILDVDGRLVVLENGNVGIGTTSPAYALDIYRSSGAVGSQIAGTAQVYNVWSGASGTNRMDLYVFSNPANGAYIGTVTNTKLGLYTNNTEKVTITTSGNVGIGNANPQKTLDIAGTFNLNATSTATLQGRVGIGTASLTDLYGLTIATTTTFSALTNITDLRVATLNATTTNIDDIFATRARIATVNATTTNVGTLTAYGLSILPDARIASLNSTTTKVDNLTVNTQAILANTRITTLNATTTNIDDIFATRARIATLNATTTNVGNLRVYGSATTTGSFYGPDSFVIKEAGNVGIGTTNPSYDLHVQSSSTSPIIGTNNASSTDFLVRFNQEGAGGLFQLLQNKAAKVTVNNAGNVGIANSNPAYLLDIAGSMNLNATSTGYFNGKFLVNTTTAFGIGHPAGYGVTIATSTIITGTTTLGMNNTLVVNTNEGRVGIGTTGPSQKLEVRGHERIDTGAASGWLEFAESGTVRGYLGYGDDGALFTGAIADSIGLRATGAFHLGTNGNNIRMTVDSTGNVGIGNVSPAFTLDVAGSLNLNSTSTAFMKGKFLVNTTTAFGVDLAEGWGVTVATSSLFYNNVKILGNATSTGSLTIGSLLNCDTIDTDTNGLFKCGTDATGAGGTGSNWSWGIASGWIKPSTTVGIIISASSTISSLVVPDSLTGNGVTIAQQNFWNGTSTWAGFQTQFNNAVIASTTMMTLNDISTSAKMLAIISDETGTGAMCFATLPTFTTGINVLGYSSSTSITVNGNFTVNSAGSATSTGSFYIGSKRVYGEKDRSLTLATSTLNYISPAAATSTIPLDYNSKAKTITGVYCITNDNTATIQITDGTNAITANSVSYLNCTNTGNSYTIDGANTFIAREKTDIQVGNRSMTQWINVQITENYN